MSVEALGFSIAFRAGGIFWLDCRGSAGVVPEVTSESAKTWHWPASRAATDAIGQYHKIAIEQVLQESTFRLTTVIQQVNAKLSYKGISPRLTGKGIIHALM